MRGIILLGLLTIGCTTLDKMRYPDCGDVLDKSSVMTLPLEEVEASEGHVIITTANRSIQCCLIFSLTEEGDSKCHRGDNTWSYVAFCKLK
jgi:hypothetical protein